MAISTELYLSEAIKIIENAEARAIQLRILGSLAFRIHCPKYVNILDKMERELTDIDYMGSSKQSQYYNEFMRTMGYEMDRDILIATEGSRFFFENPETKLGVDIFVDKLDYCHTIWMKDRLELDKPTITIEDLLQEKMQIVEINMKDIKDTLVLLLEHDFGENDKEKIDINYISKVLSNDWGFFYTFTNNLKKCKNHLKNFENLSNEQKSNIDQKIDELLVKIENHPKTLRWKMRSKIGTRIKWYKDVNAKETMF